MSKNTNILKIGKLTVLALLVFLIAYAGHDKRKISNSKRNAITREAPVKSVEKFTFLNDSIVNFAIEFIGTPYVANGCGKDGFDCSGFVYFVFQHFKIQVPRSSSEFEHFGTEIPIQNVQKGDVLLFLSPTRKVIGHVGIVSNPKGNQSDFIHATSGRDMKVKITSLTNSGYTRRFVKAIRIL